MATTPTTRVTQLARRMRLDVDTATYPAVSYGQLFGIEEAKLIEERRTEDDEAYEDEGAAREAVTGYSWRIEVKLDYSTNLAGSAVDPIHAFLRARFAATRAASAQASEFGIRWYDRKGLSGDAYEGRVYVKEWKTSGGNGRETVDIVLQGQGPLADITNPAADMTPVVESLSPAAGGTAAGGLVSIFGAHFTGATAVSFGGTVATNFLIVSDSHIVATKPTLTAGSKDVTVTTPAGTSATAGAANDFAVS
ncbi:phage tail tube protein [Actinoplanes aureus]|uniref:IPT/TIG domain-containing protein n=1 Tax=Actinoplanes aureus TaxID=2792083 RepID=A0A931FVF2_9ACTN|nr:IPT/TIG domain-containing protein [Actinoplanes aureus]MBG0560727.1 IPT/TIG domain-containing protein [Actinoplanes aureus]